MPVNRCWAISMAIFLCVPFIVFGQKTAEKDLLMQAFAIRKHYEEHMLVDSILEKTHPKLFEQMPREFFKRKMMEVMDDEILAYSIENLQIDSTLPVLHFENTVYVPILIKGTNRLKMQSKHVDDLFTRGELQLNAKDLFQTLCDDMRSKPESSDVICDDGTKTFTLTKRLQTLFIFDKTVPGSWCFLDYSPAHLPFFRKHNTLPTAILDKL